MYCARPLQRLAALVLIGAMAACGGGGGGPGPVLPSPPSIVPRPATPAIANALAVTVDAGPAGSGYNVNRLYANITICLPGSATRCQTIDHVLVDTGSTGLRLLSSALASGLNLQRSEVGGRTLLSCAQFIDNTFAWGPVATADIVLAGETAPSVPIQIIADPDFNNPHSTCSAGGTSISSVTTLGAKGILGIGLFKEDCGAGCVGNAFNGFYYTCTDPTCQTTTGAAASIVQQLKNPVPLFPINNNGILVDLPPVSPPGVAAVNGTLYFGIGTQSNNGFTSGSVLAPAANTGYFNTLIGGKNLNFSFLDTGSNGLFFNSDTLPACSGLIGAGFYCPASNTPLSATLNGSNNVPVTVSFAVDNAASLFSGGGRSVLPTLAGPIGDAFIFDWGLPFFYGRRVFIGIEDAISTIGTGPYYAF